MKYHLDPFTPSWALPTARFGKKVLRFRPRPDGSGGSVALGVDAPRSWPILR